MNYRIEWMAPLLTFFSRVLAAITAVVTLAAFIALLDSGTLKRWVKTHSHPLAIALVVAVLIIWLFVGYVFALRRTLKINSSKVTGQAEEPIGKPAGLSMHDRRLFETIRYEIPPDGLLISWLKSDFVVKWMSLERLEALDLAIKTLSLQPLGFDDEQLNQVLTNLLDALTLLSASVTMHLQLDPGGSRVCLSSNLTEKTYREAVQSISGARDAAIERYDSLYRLIHQKGLED
jgi:hypothetical protein